MTLNASAALPLPRGHKDSSNIAGVLVPSNGEGVVMRRSLPLYSSDDEEGPRLVGGATAVAACPRSLGRRPKVGLPSPSHARHGVLT